jgi:hypothetical protein
VTQPPGDAHGYAQTHHKYGQCANKHEKNTHDRISTS